MVIRTNVFSINSHRNLSNVGGTQKKSAQRLSSGYRINSAADDAAGLAISESMRAQIRGLDQASINAQDAVGLIQTAEGAMSTVSDMVIRIRELMVQAANDTHTWQNREMIQQEIDQLMTEINDVTFRTQFNTRTLLDGGLGGKGGGAVSPVSLQWLVFQQVRVVGLAHSGGKVGPHGFHPNPNNRNETSLRNDIIKLQTELTQLARRVGDRLMASGDMTKTQIYDMFNSLPHDFSTLVPHMRSAEIQEMQNIENRLDNFLRTALRTAEEITDITQNQLNALGGNGAINSDGSNVFIEQALDDWNATTDGALQRLNEIRNSVLGPSSSTFYPDGYINHLQKDINDIASLYNIIGYIVGFPGLVPNPNYQPPPLLIPDPNWVRPNMHENPEWRQFEDDFRTMIPNPNPQPLIIDPAYRWEGSDTLGRWVNRTTGEEWGPPFGDINTGPFIGDPRWQPLIPAPTPPNPHERWIPCPDPNPPEDGDPCSCSEATCRLDWRVPHPQIPNDGSVPAPPFIRDPNWERPRLREPNMIPNPDYPGVPPWHTIPGNTITVSIPPQPQRTIVEADPNYRWISDPSVLPPFLGAWVDRNNVPWNSPDNGNPDMGPTRSRIIPGHDGYDEVRPAPGVIPPPRLIQDGYRDGGYDWSIPHPLIPNTEYMIGDTSRPAIFSGRTLNNLEKLLDLSLGAFGTVNLESNALWFQFGASSMQGMITQIKGMHTGVLGGGRGDLTTLIDVREKNGIPISKQLEIIDTAEGIVNIQRSQLGAVQNRLDFTRQSVDISSENLSSAESRIRDADMAKEMMRFTASQVLQQAGISMLAQGNQLPTSILQLLQ